MGTSDLNFVAIDFETANPDQASVCQVGIAKVLNGTIVETTSWFVVPPTGVDSFEPRFIGIHGITPKQVRRHGISWQDSLQRIQDVAAGLPFVAHNTSFDKTVYRRASERVGVAVPDSRWLDTVALARRHVPSPNHRLPTVIKALELPDFRHHEAEADAIAAAQIVLEISKRQQLTSLDALWPRRSKAKRTFYPAQRFTRVGDLPGPNGQAQPDHPFFGHHVVITGDLAHLSRDDFIVKVAEFGGQPQLNVTKKTTMLVVATHDVLPHDYDRAAGSGKERKAGEYIAAGQRIEVIGASQAIAYLRHDAATFVAAEVKPAAPAEPEPVVAPPEEMSIPQAPSRLPPTPLPPPPPEAPVSVHDTIPPPEPRMTARPKRTQRAAAVPAGLVSGIAWTLIVLSALLVLLVLVALTALVFDSSVDFTVLHWIIGCIIFIPLSAAPGALGVYLRRRQKKKAQRSTTVR